jgi:hypothetical protein
VVAPVEIKRILEVTNARVPRIADAQPETAGENLVLPQREQTGRARMCVALEVVRIASPDQRAEKLPAEKLAEKLHESLREVLSIRVVSRVTMRDDLSIVAM